MIKIQLHGRDVSMTQVLRTHVERRLGLALGRFGERIGRVKVKVSKASGPLDGGHKRCEISVGLRPRGLRVEDTDADMFAAVDHAADRVSRAVARALEREQAWDDGTSAVGSRGGSRT